MSDAAAHCVFEATATIVADFPHLFSASSWLTWLVMCTRACVDRQTCLQKPRQWHSSLWILSRYRDPPAQCQVSPSYELSKLAAERHLVPGVVSCNDALCLLPDAYSGQAHLQVKHQVSCIEHCSQRHKCLSLIVKPLGCKMYSRHLVFLANIVYNSVCISFVEDSDAKIGA